MSHGGDGAGAGWGRLIGAVREKRTGTGVRLDAIQGNGLRFTFPTRGVASSPRLARAVARAWCRIQWPPHGVPYSCPANWGLTYRVQFGAAGRRIGVIDPDVTGCQWTGMDRFWRALGQAMGVPDPATALQGCSPLIGQACPKNATFTT